MSPCFAFIEHVNCQIHQLLLCAFYLLWRRISAFCHDNNVQIAPFVIVFFFLFGGGGWWGHIISTLQISKKLEHYLRGHQQKAECISKRLNAKTDFNTLIREQSFHQKVPKQAWRLINLLNKHVSLIRPPSLKCQSNHRADSNP